MLAVVMQPVNIQTCYEHTHFLKLGLWFDVQHDPLYCYLRILGYQGTLYLNFEKYRTGNMYMV